jgi:hypothetical protein
MKAKILFGICLIGQSLLAQTEQKKSVPDFSELYVSVNCPVKLQKADAPYVIIMGKDSGVSVNIQSSDGKLLIKNDGKKLQPEKITVGYVKLSALDVSGAANVKSDTTIEADDLKLNINGASKCRLSLKVNTLSSVVSGAASLTLNGSAQKMDAIATGASTLRATELVTENATVITSGASKAKVNVTGKLEGSASGASTLAFTGDTKETQLNQSGAATIRKSDQSGDLVRDVQRSSGSGSGSISVNGDSTKRYTINGRYEIIVHDYPNDSAWMHRHHRKGIRKQNWAGIELFQNGYTTYDNKITLPAGSDYMSLDYGTRNLGWNLNLMEKDFRFAHGKMQFVTGLGFSFNSFALKNKTTLNADSSFTGYKYDSLASFSKNKLKESFITVPLLLELNTSHRDSRNFHIAAGVIGGLKLGSRTKQFYSEDGHEFHQIRKDDYNLYPFKLDATVRVGYGQFTMFATYSLTPLFQEGKGPQLYPFTLGIRIIPF